MKFNKNNFEIKLKFSTFAYENKTIKIMFRKGFYKGWLTNESLLQLRKEIVLGSIYLWDYENSFNISRVQVCTFFEGFIEYVNELMAEDGKDNSHFKEYDTEENLLAWYGCFDENPFTKFS